MIRSFLPTDLIGFFFQGRALPNQAKTKDNLGKKETYLSLVGAFLARWFIQDGWFIWVSTDKASFQGLASARNRPHSNVWEVDYLLFNEKDVENCQVLLEKLSLIVSERGRATKLFLRLSVETPLADAAKGAGFIPYLHEHLYHLEKEKCQTITPTCASSYYPRLRKAGDEYRLFELFQALAPASVRRVEGMTFEEWQGIKDMGRGKSWEREWVYEKGDKFAGWLRVSAAGNIGQFEVMLHPEEEEVLVQLIEHGLNSLSHCRHLLCLAPSYLERMGRLLEAQGFERVAEYSVLVKELALLAQEPCLAPLQA